MKTAPHWEKIGLFPHHGIALPLSSLRSKKSCGVGEFLDLIPLIDWCKERGFDCLELLPINDTGDDISPYNPISSVALDPIYLSLSDLTDEQLTSFVPLNQLPRWNRLEVWEAKRQWLMGYFDRVGAEKRKDYLDFASQNPWLIPYAKFKVLSTKYGSTNWKTWGSSQEKIPEKELEFHYFLQYLSFSQWEKVKLHAESREVFLKGDIPILISPESVDVWSYPHLFRLDVAAGAPPDYYTPAGQNWGFPIFHWEEMRKTHFAWWKERLKVASRLYHLYRIDHVVGFFRIWAIPLGASPLEGFFVPQERSLWEAQGREILEMMIEASPMLPIAEDLGTIPHEVYPVLRNLGVCGTKVIRWERHRDGSYIPYAQYEPFSMTTVSTWDCDTTKGWWKNFPDEAEHFAKGKKWSYTPELSHHQLLMILTDAHHTPSYFHINLLQEYQALFPELVWPELQQERINIPGTLLSTNWTYRCRPYLEELIAHRGLQGAIEKILRKEG